MYLKKIANNSALKKYLSGLRDTDPPQFCPICGDLKKEYQVPDGVIIFDNGQRRVSGQAEPERIRVLSCDCEMHHAMLKEWFKNNLEIYGSGYDAWRLGSKADENKIRHYALMLKCKSEIDRTNALIARK